MVACPLSCAYVLCSMAVVHCQLHALDHMQRVHQFCLCMWCVAATCLCMCVREPDAGLCPQPEVSARFEAMPASLRDALMPFQREVRMDDTRSR